MSQVSAGCTHPGQRQHGRPAAHSCPQTWCSVLKAVSGTMTKVQKLGEVTSKAGSLVACSHRGCSPGSLLPSACGRCFSTEARPNSRTRTPHFDLAQGPHGTNSAAGAPRPTRDLVHFGAPPPNTVQDTLKQRHGKYQKTQVVHRQNLTPHSHLSLETHLSVSFWPPNQPARSGDSVTVALRGEDNPKTGPSSRGHTASPAR